MFYDEVLVKIYTHRTKDVTDFDFKVAVQMDMIAKKKHGAIKPDYDLDLMSDNQSLTSLTAKIITNLEPILRSFKPDLVLLHGDTTTTLAGGLSAYYQKIKIIRF